MRAVVRHSALSDAYGAFFEPEDMQTPLQLQQQQYMQSQQYAHSQQPHQMQAVQQMYSPQEHPSSLGTSVFARPVWSASDRSGVVLSAAEFAVMCFLSGSGMALLLMILIMGKRF